MGWVLRRVGMWRQQGYGPYALGKSDSPMGYEFHIRFQAKKPESQRIPLSSLSQPANPAVSLNETVLLFMILPCGVLNKTHLSGSPAAQGRSVCLACPTFHPQHHEVQA